MITEETVTHVAKLARLELTPDETTRYTQELSKILHLVDELSEIDMSDISLDTAPEQPTLFRADNPVHAYERDLLLSNAPQEEDGFFRVPKILDEAN